MIIVLVERPVAEIKPIAERPHQSRPFGLCAAGFAAPADFDKPLPDSVLGERVDRQEDVEDNRGN